MSGPTKEQLINKLKMSESARKSLQAKYDKLCEELNPVKVQNNAMKRIYESRDHELKASMQEADGLRRVIAAMAHKIHGGM